MPRKGDVMGLILKNLSHCFFIIGARPGCLSRPGKNPPGAASHKTRAGNGQGLGNPWPQQISEDTVGD